MNDTELEGRMGCCPDCGAEMHDPTGPWSHEIGGCCCIHRQRDQWRERALAAEAKFDRITDAAVRGAQGVK